jgi:hypothetical protein
MAINKKTGMNLLMAIVVLLVLYYLFMMGKPSEKYQDMMGDSPVAGMMMDSSSPAATMGMMMDDEDDEDDEEDDEVIMEDSGEVSGLVDSDMDYAPVDFTGPAAAGAAASCGMNSGVGLASSLLPYKEAKQENYGDFAPEEILKGQNFLDPRQQIGFPETIGGTLRNGNQQIRADPPNPKQAFLWNNSTIVPDLMQRTMCT